MARKQQDNAPAPAAQPAYKVVQAREGPLVGGAGSAGRAGVRDGVQARRGGGGAPAGGVRNGRVQQPW